LFAKGPSGEFSSSEETGGSVKGAGGIALTDWDGAPLGERVGASVYAEERITTGGIGKKNFGGEANSASG